MTNEIVDTIRETLRKQEERKARYEREDRAAGKLPADLLSSTYQPPAPTETLADRLRELADELNDQVARDERVMRVFMGHNNTITRYSAHYQGRAEGYAYVVKRLLALLDGRDAKASH